MNAKQTFIKSTLILALATLLSKIIGSIYRIPLQNIAGDYVNGIFQAVYPVYMVALTLSVAGIPIAISQLIARAQSRQEEDRIYIIYRTATILAIAFGILSFTLINSLSDYIAYVLGGPEVKFALFIVSFTLLFAPYMAVYRGYFQGFSDMKPTGFSQVFEQLIRVTIILALAIILVRNQFAGEAVAGWIMIGSIVGVLCSLAYLKYLFAKSPLRVKKGTIPFNWLTFKEQAIEILKISLPICIGAITMVLLNFVDSISIPSSLRANGIEGEEILYQIGIYGRGLTLVQIITVIATSMVLPLVPMITKLLVEKKQADAKQMVEKTHFITHLLAWPASIGIFVLVVPINITLYKDVVGSDVLGIIGISSVFTALVLLGTGVLQGINLAKLGAYIIVGGTLLKFVLNYLLVANLGLIGAAYSTLIVYIILFVANSYYIYRHLPYHVWNSKISKILLSSVIMGAVVYAPSLLFNLEVWNRKMSLLYVVALVLVGVIVYVLALFLLKAVTKKDLEQLPYVGKIFNSSTNEEGTSNNKKRRNTIIFARGGPKMKKGLWILLIISLLLTIPGIYERHVVETDNMTYELVVPYASVEMIVSGSELQLSEVLRGLEENGVQAISIEPETVQSLIRKGMVTSVTPERMTEMAYFDSKYEAINLQKEGMYIFIDHVDELTDSLKAAFPAEKITTGIIDGKQYFFIEGKQEPLLKTIIGYVPSTIDTIKEAGLNVVVRVPNSSSLNADVLYEDAINIAKEHQSFILYAGEEVVGYPSVEKIKAFNQQLLANDLGIYTIEFTTQKGMQTAARAVENKIIRLHSVNMTAYDIQESIDRSIRAIKERNFRTIFITANEKANADEAYADLIQVANGIQENLPFLYDLGKAETFKKMDIPTWSHLAAMVAAASFIALAAAYIFNFKWLTILGFIGMIGLMGLYVVTDRLVVVQAIALAIGIVTPIFAVLPLKQALSMKDILKTYGRAILISFIGIFIMIGLLNGNEFLVKMEEFRGVKLVYMIPIAFVLLYACWRDIPKILNANVKYWHLVIIGIIGVAGIYYMTRTGNSGSVSTMELQFRSFLENTLYVRPRTKEFLIGFPLFILAIYMTRHSLKAGHYILVGGVIGFLSMANTFMHFHIPMFISLLRTAYSLVFGLILGFVLIFIYKWCYKFYLKRIKPRWQQ